MSKKVSGTFQGLDGSRRFFHNTKHGEFYILPLERASSPTN